MADFLRVVYEGVVEFSPNEAIGALMIGLALALACYGICFVGRKLSTNPLPLLCGLIFLVSAISMAVGFGHSRSQYIRRGELSARANSRPGPGPGGFPGPGGPWRGREPRGGGPMESRPIGRTLLHKADANRDGQLTPEEAAQFVREADKDGKGWVDALQIDQAHAAKIDSQITKEIAPVPIPPRPDREAN